MIFNDALKAAAARDKLRLHTPGHKGTLCALDITELTDDAFPYPALNAAQSRAASVYGAKHARYLSGGSSQGVKSALRYCDCDGIADVNSHRAVFDGFGLAGKKCITTGERGGVRAITVKDIDKALNPAARAVVVTSPTYYGYCADIDGIKEYCRRKGLLFVCDGAHGAHFGFGDRLPESPVPIADICNVSTHKTLSALTQTALIFDNLTDADSDRLSQAVDIMGTTSPSYILYASIESAVEKAASAETRRRYNALYDPLTSLKKHFPFLNNDDYTRLVLDCAPLGIAPDALNAALIRRGVYSERVDARYIIFIFTAENTPSDAAALSAALEQSIAELK